MPVSCSQRLIAAAFRLLFTMMLTDDGVTSSHCDAMSSSVVCLLYTNTL